MKCMNVKQDFSYKQQTSSTLKFLDCKQERFK
ncbi:hypothetical protein T01_3451 [Trichinella spiralis]|uniref:Uncharacterized protein n=1 Tax=Trichinella spiralis TaxID=6334 RepID=A0A0V0YQF0_TRISP|nr:hypothetical protein T01_3451 [Trichinella spiralis]